MLEKGLGAHIKAGSVLLLTIWIKHVRTAIYGREFV